MKDNRFQLPDKGPQKWTPEDRALWLAKHGAPANMRLVTDLELHVIAQGLEAERKKAVDHEAKSTELQAKVDRAIADTDSFLTLLQSCSNWMDDPTGLAIIYAEAGRVRETLNFLRQSSA